MIEGGGGRGRGRLAVLNGKSITKEEEEAAVFIRDCQK